MRGGNEQQLILPLTTQEKSKLQIAFQHEPIEEYPSDEKKVAAYMNYHGIRKIVNVAKTIMARDFKGFSSGFDSTNGVIEWREIIKSK